MLSLCTFQLPSIQSPIDSGLQSPNQSFSTTSIVTGPRTSCWWSCPRSIFSSCVAPSSKSSRLIRFFQGPQLQSDAQTTPQKQRTQTTGCQPNKNTVKWDINVDGVNTSFSASEVMNASQSEACRCCTRNCSLSARHSTSPRFALHVHKRRPKDIFQSVPQLVRARFARSLTAALRCEPSAARNVKWYTTSWLWRAGAICH